MNAMLSIVVPSIVCLSRYMHTPQRGSCFTSHHSMAQLVAPPQPDVHHPSPESKHNSSPLRISTIDSIAIQTTVQICRTTQIVRHALLGGALRSYSAPPAKRDDDSRRQRAT